MGTVQNLEGRTALNFLYLCSFVIYYEYVIKYPNIEINYDQGNMIMVVIIIIRMQYILILALHLVTKYDYYTNMFQY
jgi:hypothetical protein